MMHVPVEIFPFVMYLDSLFTENREREVTPLRALPTTLNRLHAQAMREHARENALSYRADETWCPMPDWRLDRHVIRTALYLRERLEVEPGQRIAIISELLPEWLIADLAALGLGAVSVAIDPSLRGEELADALEDVEPRVTFVTAAIQRKLDSHGQEAPAYGQLIVLGTAAVGGSLTITEVLDQGGTLDTPERAQAYRSEARSLGPDDPAIQHCRRAPGGGWEVVELSQGGVIERLRAEWAREPALPGDVSYVSDPIVSLTARLALYAFLGDGYTTTALASAGRELSDLAAIRPTKIVAPAAVFEEAVRAGLAGVAAQPNAGGWLSRVQRVAPRARERSERRAIREALGGRARWIASIDPLDRMSAQRLASVTTVAQEAELTQEVRYE
jgi:long-subunit acyl-CoA synthetase (AMP-forming)